MCVTLLCYCISMSEIWIPAGYVVGYFDIEYDDGIIGHHGGHVKKGIGGVDNPEDSIGPNRVLDSVHQKDKTTLQQVVQDDKAEKGHFWHFFQLIHHYVFTNYFKN